MADWATISSMATAGGTLVLADFRAQARDLYIPAGDSGFWQGAIRGAEDPDHARLVAAMGSAKSW